ncbi:crotonase/enoyl-CoA hydratase family protein [Jatrophihabitans sp.]|uniref:crotonase/enoyl-CoA hydratase family protein n=1 Tax=Jatrophihabitans sp. TaxID=1932789 RepID=UPI0030C7203D|nr:caiD [Jatrophihabitans sp.]
MTVMAATTTDNKELPPDALAETVGPVLVITINRPDQRNAMTLAAAQIIADAVDLLDSSPDLAVGVITGAGGTFCAGMDLKRFALGERPRVPGRGFAGITEAPPRKPLIAAVEGWALGGGFELVLACDLVVAAETASFGLPEVKRGLAAAGGGAVRLPRRMPLPIALEILLTGEPLSADRAAHFGLVNDVVAPGQALDRALELGRLIAANAPLAVRLIKQLAIDSADWPSSELFSRQAPYVDPIFASDDAKEGVTAFSQRRAPRWTGQ